MEISQDPADTDSSGKRTAKYMLWGKIGAAAVIVFSIVMFAVSLRSSGENAEKTADTESTELSSVAVNTNPPAEPVSPAPAQTAAQEKSAFNEDLLRRLNAPRYPKASSVKVQLGRPKLED